MTSKENIKISKTLSWILRHGANNIGVKLDDNGWANIEDLKAHSKLKNITVKKIEEVVENCPKQRFAIKVEENITYIRANQGHSISDVNLQLQEVSAEINPYAYHGTFMKNWHNIREQGLSRMSRQHIHFSPDFNINDSCTRMRRNCDLIIEVDINKIIKDNYEVLKSENDVILCSGNKDGYLPSKYFSKVIDRKTGIDILSEGGASSLKI